MRFMALEECHRLGREGNRLWGPVLRRTKQHWGAGFERLLRHGNMAMLQVDIVPAQSTDLPFTDPSGEREGIKRCTLGIGFLDHGQKAAGFVGRPTGLHGADMLLPPSRFAHDQRCHIADDEALQLGRF